MHKTIEMKNGNVVTLDQTKLPDKEVRMRLKNCRDVCQAIREMKIRGAPLIGAAAGYGLALTAYKSKAFSTARMILELERSAQMLLETRPTGFNLKWAVQRIMEKTHEFKRIETLRAFVLEEADRIRDDDIQSNIRIGRNGSVLLKDGDCVLTHCNAGALATAGYGTALGVVRAAIGEGKKIRVIATETRPLLQGARLTAYELISDNIPVTIITDNMVGYVMQQKYVDKVIVGADRVLSSGHAFNKIGTYVISVIAKEHHVPFYIAAPLSTFDFNSASDSIVIEQRRKEEVLFFGNKRIAAKGAGALNPAFDMTPPENITAIITEEGAVFPPYEEAIGDLAKRASFH